MVEIGSVVFYIQIFEDCMGNLHDLIVASKGLIFYCVLKLWFQILGTLHNFLFQVSKGQYYLNVIKSIEPRGWQCILGVVVLPLIRSVLNVGAMKLKSLKCVANMIISMFSVSQNPDADDGNFDGLLVSMAAIQENDGKPSFVFIGEFNAHHKEWLNSVSNTDCHGLRALDFSSDSGCGQIIHNSTHWSGDCLDLTFTDTPGVVAGNVVSPIGTSGHYYVSAIIKTEHAEPDISFSRKLYLKSQADCNGIQPNYYNKDRRVFISIYINIFPFCHARKKKKKKKKKKKEEEEVKVRVRVG